MAKRKPAKAKPPTKTVAKLVRGGMSIADARQIDSTVTPEAQAQNEHYVTNFGVIETVHGGKIKQHTSRVIKVARTPLDRWGKSGKLDIRQMAAVEIYARAYRKEHSPPRVVANWSAVISGNSGGAAEENVASVIKAKQTLAAINQFVFQQLGLAHTSIFHNVVIWDEADGVAGARAGFTGRGADAIALFVVQTVASMIAKIFIDGQWPEYDAPELNLHVAPRPIGKAAA